MVYIANVLHSNCPYVRVRTSRTEMTASIVSHLLCSQIRVDRFEWAVALALVKSTAPLKNRRPNSVGNDGESVGVMVLPLSLIHI